MDERDLRGAELAREFFADAVRPLLSGAMPRLRYAAARLGSGSDVLGLDDVLSRDHDWGCRLTLLVDADDRGQVPRVRRLLEDELPERFCGFPVRFPVTWDSSVSHQVEVATVADFTAGRLGVDPTQGMSALDWLSVTGQSVLEVTAGPVFADDLVSLAFMLSRRWAPYPKWRGTVFRSLPVAARLGPPLGDVVAAPGWREREEALAAACDVLLDVQRERGYPAPDVAVIPFFSRPYRTVNDAVSQRLVAGICDPDVARLPLVGSIEQWADSADVLSSPGRRAALRATYRAWATG